MRWKTILLAGGLWLAPAPALAQTLPQTTSNTPATDAVGPRELQNFSLPGTTTKAAEQPAPAPAATAAPPRVESPRAETRATASAPQRRTPAARQTPHDAVPAAAAPAPNPAAKPDKPTDAPATATSVAGLTTTAPQANFSSAPALPSGPTETLAPEHRLSILPWLLAALALAGATLFLLWRRSHREAVAAGPELDLFVAPQPAPAAPAPRAAPVPAPQPESRPAPPPIAAPPRASGIVASRLRPSLELGMQPLRCLVDDENVTIEFEIELFNAGTAPARAVIAEASLFNASADQEQELAAFYVRPAGPGERIDGIGPMKRMTFTSQVVAPRAAIHEYELGGRKAFVPVLAFNAHYEWTGGKSQSSLAYLLGRETRGEKLAPLHLDGDGRDIRGLGARVLPTAVRT